MSFILELFDTLEIPKVLDEVKGVLKLVGRLAVASLPKEKWGIHTMEALRIGQ